MRARIEKLDWMSPATKARGAEEARHAHDQGRLPRPRRATIRQARRSATTTSRRRAARRRARLGVPRRARLNGPVDRADWGMTPQTNDAYNGPLQRHRASRPRILQPPFFDPNADPAINYGAHRRRDRPRDDPRLRRPGPQDRRRRHAPRLVDRRRTPPSSRPGPSAAAPVLRLRAAAGRARERRPDHGREHRRPGRADAGARRLPRLAARQAGAGDRRPDRRPAGVPGLGAGVARQGRATTPCASSWSATRTRRGGSG